MIRAAVLGPAGTFSELAVEKYKKKTNQEFNSIFYPTITKVVNAIGDECDIGIVPIENTLDGFVQVTLDLLIEKKVNIINELVIPIQFAFAANSNIEEVKKIYVQFKTQGQCCKFLESFKNVKIITTESNGESVQKIKEGLEDEGAIIPEHMINSFEKLKFSINCVTDSDENETRFIVLSADEKEGCRKGKHYKTSIAIMDAADDRPGALFRVLEEFAQRQINLSSIISRPTKKGLGKYYFFIDIDGSYPEEENVRQAIEVISKHSLVKIIGSYSTL
ncbi:MULTISPECIES: prephenate dehydratase [Clostridium]|uniref:prephenate dehydratase n=1 Tax=Clostridium TaxID=1485 RepID=UPI00069E2466|nr:MULTISPECIES: prephenate dehydratase [Clostridium]KOF57389.1 prephenate dehydratase [Clostridium sp. DMHC 10]MCD2348769.1 prephenate dehydratase [Clostridium guangxiense]